MAQCIAISQVKGGEAKSTTALNLCGALIDLGYKAIISDMDKDKPDLFLLSENNENINFVKGVFEDNPREVLNDLKNDYDYVIIDSSPNFTAAGLKAIYLSDIVILPCLEGAFDYNGLIQTAAACECADKPYYYLASKCNKSRKLSQNLITNIEKSGRGLKTIIPERTEIVQSIMEGKWIGDYARKSEAHEAFLKLANEIVDILKNPRACNNG